MNRVSVDTRKNRIYIRLSDGSRQGLQDLLHRIEKSAVELAPGFTCLTELDISGALLGENRDLVLQIQGLLSSLGLGKAVRVVSPQGMKNGSLETLNIVSTGYSAQHVASREEAEKLLDAYERDSERFLKKAGRQKALFKIVDRGGWEDDLRFGNYGEALRRLKNLRASGRKRAIIVDARVSLRSKGSG